ncbi:MAG: hypothetical protein NZ581_07915 [Candidatus Caldarchaeum sp.]|nr:hypothetical protein [Candidatus Caldarchaeum sp.]MDW8436099.1 hypothetical protein [Candidatus Caldarchaeum sp.]
MPKVVVYFSLNNEETVFGDFMLRPGLMFHRPHPGFEKLVEAGFLRKVEAELEQDVPPGIHEVLTSYEDFVAQFKKEEPVPEPESRSSEESVPVEVQEAETVKEESRDSEQETVSEADDDEDFDDEDFVDMTNEEIYELALSKGWTYKGRKSRKKAIEFLKSLDGD